MEAKILELIDRLQRAIKQGANVDFVLPLDMANMLADFLKYARRDYADAITPPLIAELYKEITEAVEMINNTEFWCAEADMPMPIENSNLRNEAVKWLKYLKAYYRTLTDGREMLTLDLCEPAEDAPPTPQDVAQPLPTSHPLNSPKVQLIFEELNKQGYVAKYGSKWEWKAGAGLYGYFVARMSNVFNLHKVKDESRLLDWALFSKVILNSKKLQQSAMSSNSRKALLYNDEPPKRGKYTELYAIIGN